MSNQIYNIRKVIIYKRKVTKGSWWEQQANTDCTELSRSCPCSFLFNVYLVIVMKCFMSVGGRVPAYTKLLHLHMIQVVSNSVCQEYCSGTVSLSMAAHWETAYVTVGFKSNTKTGFLLLLWAMRVGVCTRQDRIKWWSRQNKAEQGREDVFKSKFSKSVGLNHKGYSSEPKLQHPECQESLSLAYFVSLWHQMALPRARSPISHHHLGTAMNWSRTHPSLIKCCNGMQ